MYFIHNFDEKKKVKAFEENKICPSPLQKKFKTIKSFTELYSFFTVRIIFDQVSTAIFSNIIMVMFFLSR